MINHVLLFTLVSLLGAQSSAAVKGTRFMPSCQELLVGQSTEQLYQLLKTLTLMEGMIEKHLQLLTILGQGYRIVGHPVELKQLAQVIATAKVDVFSASRETNANGAQSNLDRVRQLTEHVEFLEGSLWNLTQPIEARSARGLEDHSWSSPNSQFDFP